MSEDTGAPAEASGVSRPVQGDGGEPAGRRYDAWWSLPSSTMYGALSPRRTTLPALRTVRSIVMSCIDDDEDAVEEWVSVWRNISLREFTRTNPPPAEQLPGGRAPLRVVASQ